MICRRAVQYRYTKKARRNWDEPDIKSEPQKLSATTISRKAKLL